jgi:hypothetical protein
MFGHHRDADFQPEEPETKIGEDRTDEELDADLTELEGGVVGQTIKKTNRSLNVGHRKSLLDAHGYNDLHADSS